MDLRIQEMKRPITIYVALLWLFISLTATPENELKEANMLLDMMEYKSAIGYYEKALSDSPQQRDICKRTAYAYFRLKKSAEAIKLLKQELEAFPDNADAYNLLAFILYQENGLEDIPLFLEEHGFNLVLSEDNPRMGGLAYFILGVQAKEKKEFYKARQLFQKAIDKDYNPLKCCLELADIEIIQGDLDTAQRTLVMGSREYGLQPEFLFLQGFRYFEKSKQNNYFLIQATKSFEQAVKINPSFKDALFNLACLGYNHQNYRQASEYFKRVLALNPEDESIKTYTGCAQKKLNRDTEEEFVVECPEKIDLAKECIQNPDREYNHPFINDRALVVENINFLGLELIRNGKLHDAIRTFRNGLEISPDSPEMHFNLGMVLSWLNYFKDAERHALLALRKRGFFWRTSAYRKQEILKSKRKEMDEKLEIPPSEWTFDLALEKGNYFADAFDLLGNIYFKKQDFEKSILAFNKVLDINPEDAVGHFNLGCAYWALDDQDRAETAWKKAIKYEDVAREREARSEVSEDQLSISLLVLNRPVAYRAHRSLARLYLERNWPEKAIEEFERAVELDSSDPEPYLELGKLYQAENDVKRAIFCYEKYLYQGGKKESEVKEILKSLKKERYN